MSLTCGFQQRTCKAGSGCCKPKDIVRGFDGLDCNKWIDSQIKADRQFEVLVDTKIPRLSKYASAFPLPVSVVLWS